MKKGICIGLIFSCLFCTFACGRQSDPSRQVFPPALPTAFESDMTVSFEEYSVLSHLKREGENQITITFQEPPLLQKLAFQYDGVSYTLFYAGLSLQVDPKRFPETGFGALVGETLRTSLDLDALRIRHLEEGNWEYSGTIAAGDFTLIQNAQTGFIDSLSIPDMKFSAAFQNFVSLEG